MSHQYFRYLYEKKNLLVAMIIENEECRVSNQQEVSHVRFGFVMMRLQIHDIIVPKTLRKFQAKAMG